MGKTYFLKRYKTSYTVAICLIFVIPTSECANILAVFPTPFIRHQFVFRPLINELVKRGHQVTVITTNPQFPKGQSPQNLTEIDVQDLSYNIWNKAMAVENRKKSDSQSRVKAYFEAYNEIFEEQMKSFEIQALVNNKKKTFDLLIVESCMRVTISFSYLYKAPVIKISSLGPIYETLDLTGAATNPLVYPIVLRQRINEVTMWEKISEIYTQYKAEQVYRGIEKSENEMLKRIFGWHIPALSELKKNVELIFLNIHHIWDFNRPVPPNVIYLGSLNVKPSKDLPQKSNNIILLRDLKHFLDSSKNGVIYISFGTNVKPSLLPPEKVKIICNVFSKLPYDVLWKWDNDQVPGLPEKVKISKWFPQSDLLKHPNVKLFITQGGLQSTDEAITAGVPLIGLPMLTDQWYNVEMYTVHNIGIKLDINTITDDVLENAIETVIKNPSYRQNIIKLRNVIHDQPLSSLDRAMWWIEHLLRHGNAAHLRSPAAFMSSTEYYALDLMLLLLSITIIVSTLSAYLIYYIAAHLLSKFIIKMKGVKEKIY